MNMTSIHCKYICSCLVCGLIFDIKAPLGMNFRGAKSAVENCKFQKKLEAQEMPRLQKLRLHWHVVDDLNSGSSWINLMMWP